MENLMQEGYGDVGSPVGIFEAFRQFQAKTFQESGSTSDFPNYLHLNVIVPRFFNALGAAQSNWRQIVSITSLPDFRPQTLVGLSELPDLTEIVEEDDYMDSGLSELAGPGIQLGTYGRTFSIGRRVLIDDDFGRLTRIPDLMGRAVTRTQNKQIVGMLTSNPVTYDGYQMFSTQHGNLGSAALSETSLPTAITAIETQTTQNGERADLHASILYHPAQLRFTAQRLLQSTVVPQPGTGLGGTNVLQDILRPVSEPYLIDANDWYVFSDPAELAPIHVGFLNGKEDPTLMQTQGPALLGGGAYDPYNLMVDKLTWKIRHDWAVAPGEWRGAYASIVP